MTNTKKYNPWRESREDREWINSLAIPCVECGGMHWDAYHVGKCAGCATLDEMTAALKADGYID